MHVGKPFFKKSLVWCNHWFNYKNISFS